MGKGSSGGSNTVVQQSSPPPQFLQNYNQVFNKAQNLTNKPIDQVVAGLRPQQQQAFAQSGNLASQYAPYAQQSRQLYGEAAAPLSSQISSLMSPYTKDVVNATQKQFNNQNAIQQQGVIGNAVAEGAFGGDRSAVAQGITAGQQQLAEAPVIAGLRNTGFQTALSGAEAQDQLRTAAAQGVGQLGVNNYNVNAGQIQALLQAGGMQQAQQQSRLNVPYQQTGWLANIAEGLGSQAGGTSSTQYPSPSALSQIAGAGVGGLGLLGATGAFGSSGYLTGAGGLLSGIGGLFSGGADAGLAGAGALAGDSAVGAGLGDAALAASPFGLRAGGRLPHHDGGGSVANEISEAGGYGDNGSGILASAGGTGGILQDLSNPNSTAGEGILTALSLARGGLIRRDMGGGIGGPVVGGQPPGVQLPKLAISAMPLQTRLGIGPPRSSPYPYAMTPQAEQQMSGSNYGQMLGSLGTAIKTSGIMGQQRGGGVRGYADGGDLEAGMPSIVLPDVSVTAPASDMVPGGAAGLPDQPMFMGVTPDMRADAGPSIVAPADPTASGPSPASRAGIVNFWVNQGAPPQVAQGIADRVGAESQFNPDATGDLDTSHGLYQHHGSRFTALQQYADQTGAPWTDPAVQNQFAAEEVHGGDPTATAHWNQIVNAPDEATAAKLWDRYFERSAAGPGARSPQNAGGIGTTPPGTPQPPLEAQMTLPSGSGIAPQAPEAPSAMDSLTGSGVNPWLALAAAGFGMMGGTSPFPGVNIGRGASAGLNFLEQQRLSQPELRLKSAQATQAEIGAGLTKAQLDYYTNHGVNALNSNIAAAKTAAAAPGEAQLGATNQGASAQPTTMMLPHAGIAVPTGGDSSNPMFQQLDEAYRQLDFLSGAPMLPAQKAQILESIARLRDTDPRVAAAKAGMAAQAEVGPHVQEAGEKKAAEFPNTITTTRSGLVLLGGKPIYGAPIPRKWITSAADATPADPAGTPHEGFFAQPLGTPGGASGSNAGAAATPGAPVAAGQPNAAVGTIVASGQEPSGIIGPSWQTGLDPGTIRHLETSGSERADAEQKDRQETIEEGQSAQMQQAILSRLKDDAPQFTQGPFAKSAQAVNGYMRAIFGDKVPQVASYEDFIKNAGALTRAAVRETSGRAAVQEFKLIDATLPSPEMSPQGLNQVISEYQGLNDYKIAKTQAQQMWEQKNGGLGNVQGFETDWQAKVSPYTFVFNRMDPNEQGHLVSRLRGTPEGMNELSHLAQQLQYAKSAGLEPYIQ